MYLSVRCRWCIRAFFPVWRDKGKGWPMHSSWRSNRPVRFTLSLCASLCDACANVISLLKPACVGNGQRMYDLSLLVRIFALTTQMPMNQKVYHWYDACIVIDFCWGALSLFLFIKIISILMISIPKNVLRFFPFSHSTTHCIVGPLLPLRPFILHFFHSLYFSLCFTLWSSLCVASNLKNFESLGVQKCSSGCFFSLFLREKRAVYISIVISRSIISHWSLALLPILPLKCSNIGWKDDFFHPSIQLH